MQDLDGDLPIQLGVVGRVDLAHPPLPEQGQHEVAADGRSPPDFGSTDSCVLAHGWCARRLAPL